MPQLSPEESAKTITDLERMKEFEMEKDQISRIELKKSGMFGIGPYRNYAESRETGEDYCPAPNSLRQTDDAYASVQP